MLWDLNKGSAASTLWGIKEEMFANVAVLGRGRQIACAMSDGRTDGLREMGLGC